MARFTFNDPAKGEVDAIETVWGEKAGGGVVASSTFDIPATTAVGLNAEGVYAPIKAYRLVSAVGTSDTTIKIAKGSGIAVGDVIGYGTKSVASTKVDTSNADYDKVTVTMGVTIAAGAVLYQSKVASASEAAPVYEPEFITGNVVPANVGNFPVRLINGANLNKAAANVAPEVVARMKMVALV